MVPKKVVIVIDENEEAERPKSETASPLHSSTPPQEKVTDGIEGHQRNSSSSSLTIRKLGSAPSNKFWEIAEARDEASRMVSCPSNHSLRGRLSVLAHKINWVSLKLMAKEWFRNPMNWALFVWIIGVTVSGAILFLVMTGMLNSAIPNKSERLVWFEVNNQIINALFTLMCLYQHPQRLYQLVLLFRWNPADIPKLRNIYCKNGTYKPHEWAHMLVVVLLLNLNCFAQYALCGLNVGYKRSVRPPIAVGVTISIAIASAAIAGVYTIVSPLGKEYDFPLDEEAQTHTATTTHILDKQQTKSFEKKKSFMVREDEVVVETRPLWKGGIFDIWDDISVTYLSFFCGCCVFGWNMERLGFGNKYVHIATFILFCSAPFWIFNLAALNIDNDITRRALGSTGLVLCIFGLLYGGYWRIRMRKRFKLPGYTLCCNKPAVSDCAIWLCCCCCSLAQEVRTANYYDIVEDTLCKKEHNGNVELECSLLPSDTNTITNDISSSGKTEDGSQREATANPMTPPSPLLIKKEGE